MHQAELKWLSQADASLDFCSAKTITGYSFTKNTFSAPTFSASASQSPFSIQSDSLSDLGDDDAVRSAPPSYPSSVYAASSKAREEFGTVQKGARQVKDLRLVA